MSVRSRRLGVATFLAVAAAAAPASAASSKGYVVVLKAKPLASYTGGVKGRPATSPQKTGERKLQVLSKDSQSYREYLDGRQKAVVGRLPGRAIKVLHRYRSVLAGFSATLTADQAKAARKDPAVAHVFRDKFEKALDDAPADPADVSNLLGGANGATASYLGLPAGLWSSLSGGDPAPDHAGEGIVVGVIDTGITPEHPSFAADPDDGYLGLPFGPKPKYFRSICDPGVDEDGFQCNNKLIGAEFFADSFIAATSDADHPDGNFNEDERISPRDTEGHGSHTASLAAGNYGVEPDVDGNDLGGDLISGMAPAAQIAAYKALWTDGNGDNGGYTGDLVAAIEAATNDGVDVINYSIGSSGTSILGADALAFLGASDANVYVAVSAGNDGPEPGTIGDPSGAPWVTGAAAGSNGRTYTATLNVTPSGGGAAQSFKGASAGTGVTPAKPIIDAATIPAPGRTAAEAELCLNGSLAAGAAAGKIVLCKRGAPVRLETSFEVERAGGVGEVLYNATQGNDLAAYPFELPTVSVDLDQGQAIKALIASGATATITPGTGTTTQAKKLAAFSSRGPSTATPDIAKPDVEAPGVDILGANTPIPIPGAARAGLLFQVISGTSMAAPHVAGAGALVKQAHPEWSPAEVKSALMMTASGGVKTETGDDATPFDTGSGQIDPNAAAGAGLVLDVTTDDYLSYLNEADPTLEIGGDKIKATDLNLPSIANANVLNTITTSRTFSNATGSASTWDVDASVPGFDVTVGGEASGGEIDIPKNGTGTVAITATRTDAPYGAYAFGALTLTKGGQTLRIPISLKPVEIAAPDTAALTTDTPSGSSPLDVASGFSGSLFGFATGLAAPNAHPGETVSTGGLSTDTANAANRFYDVTVPEGADVLKGQIENVSPATGDPDLDLYLYYDENKDGKFSEPDERFDLSATGAANEGTLDFAPPAGNYRFVINGFATANPTTYDFTTWVVADPSPNDLANEPSVAITDPVAASIGATLHPVLKYQGLNAKGTYLGLVRYSRDAGEPADEALLDSTVVSITKTKDEPAPTPTAVPTTVPTTTPTAVPTTTPTPPIRLTATYSKVKLVKRRYVTLKVKLSRRATLSARVTKGRKVKAKSKGRTVKAGTHTVRLRLNRRLKDGTYRLTLRTVGGNQLVTKAYKLVVKKPKRK